MATILNPIKGTNNGETLNGTAVADEIKGGGGKDIIKGNNGADVLYGEAGDDTLIGGWGFDTLYGGIDHDTLIGDQGNDTLYGEDGADTLTGGIGADKYYGGSGADTYQLRGPGVEVGDDKDVDVLVFSKADLTIGFSVIDKVSGFHAGVDKIDLTALKVGTVSGAVGASTSVPGGSWASFDGNYLKIDADKNGSTDIAVQFIGINSLNIADFMI